MSEAAPKRLSLHKQNVKSFRCHCSIIGPESSLSHSLGQGFLPLSRELEPLHPSIHQLVSCPLTSLSLLCSVSLILACLLSSVLQQGLGCPGELEGRDRESTWNRDLPRVQDLVQKHPLHTLFIYLFIYLFIMELTLCAYAYV